MPGFVPKPVPRTPKPKKYRTPSEGPMSVPLTPSKPKRKAPKQPGVPSIKGKRSSKYSTRVSTSPGGTSIGVGPASRIYKKMDQ